MLFHLRERLDVPFRHLDKHHPPQLPVKLSCLDNTLECLSTSSITPLIPNFSASRFISFPSSISSQHLVFSSPLFTTVSHPRNHSLNFNRTTLVSLDALGNSLVSIFIDDRALGGKKERKSRAVLALGEKGLKTVETSVMNLVIIFADYYVCSWRLM